LSDARRNRVYLKETYIDIFSRKIDLRIGKQVILWGKADGFNPTGNLTPVDYSDILDTDNEEIGIFAVNTKFYLGDWQIQGIFSPIFQASILPSVNSRWQQDYPFFINYENTIIPARFFWKDAEMPANKFKNSQFAFRLSKNFSCMDFSLSYYNGLNDIPIISSKIEHIINDTVNIAISQCYYKHQVVGVDFSWVLGKYVIKGEGAAFFPSGVNENKPYFQYVLGFDRTFNDAIYDKNLFVIVQWIHELTAKNVTYNSKDFNHLFQKNIMSRIEIELNSNMAFALQMIYALKYEDFYIKPEFKYNISDGLNLNFSTDILGGNKNKNGFFPHIPTTTGYN
jgi:hypothetical protein